jgi:DNA-binding LacI/PurR family transcriptional regulator
MIVFFNWTSPGVAVRFFSWAWNSVDAVFADGKGCKVRKIKKNDARSQGRVTLKALAEYVGLSTGTISIVLNDTPRARVIPQRTKDRILEAARVLNYRPNPFAWALRANRSVTASDGVENAGGSSGALMFVGPEHWRRAIQAIRSAGLRVPGDVSIADVDGSPAAFFRSRWEL